MHKKKFFAGIMATVALTASVFAFPVYAGVVGQSSSWDFSKIETQSCTSDFNYGSLVIKATSEDSSNVNFDGKELKLNGAGNTKKRSICFTVVSGCTIKINCKSSSSDENRTLLIVDKDGHTLSEITAGESFATGSYTYTGFGETLYVYSKSKGIDVKSMSITYSSVPLKGDVNDDATVGRADAATVLNHIAGVSKLVDNKLLSAANPNNDGTVDMLDVIWILSHKADDATIDNTVDTTIDTSDGTVVTDYTTLTAAISSKVKNIYVANDISCGNQLVLSTGSQSLIGVPQDDGTLPVLDFAEGESLGKPGVHITSNNNVVKNLVIQHAGDNGILIKGDRNKDISYTGNTIENCILRYNNDSGLQLTNNVYKTVVKNVYSYRNCDVETRGSNADGFAVKLGAGPKAVSTSAEFQEDKNTFINCYSWENSDDGWDSFDYQYGATREESTYTYWTYKNEYFNSMCWRNGSQSVHTGYSDYVNGLSLDEDLQVVRYMKKNLSTEVYDSFVSAYNSGSLGSRTMTLEQYCEAVDSLTSITFETDKDDPLTLTQYASASYWGGNPNGFKLGSAYTESMSERTLKNCIAFDNYCDTTNAKGSGIDKNNSDCNIELENTICFNNDINYNLDGYKAISWSNAYGWDGKQYTDKLPSIGATATVTTPAAGTAVTEKLVRVAADEIIASASQNKFAVTDIFTTAFGK